MDSAYTDTKKGFLENKKRERERDLVSFETEFHAWPRGGLHACDSPLLLTPTLPVLA